MLRLLVALALVALAAPPALAQALAEPAAEAEAAVAADPFGRETPRAAVTGLLNRLAAQDYARAAQFLAMPGQDGVRVTEQGAQLAQQFQAALDRGGSLASFGALSNEPTGHLDDGLPPDTEQVGALRGEDGSPILLTRSKGPTGVPIWRVSPQTIRELRSLAPATGARGDEPVGNAFVVAGAPLRDWALLFGLAAGSYLLFWLTSAAVLALMRRVMSDHEKSSLYRLTYAALPPLSLFLAVVSFQLWAADLEASITARQTLLRYIGIVAWVALAWFALRLVDAVAGVSTARMHRKERRQAVSIILLIRRSAKVVLFAVATVAILDTLGFDVTTGLAALGIGGIALALGAQKTVENLVGSVTVVADRPVQVGDFCRVGTVVGTVEDIGMRSTRIRTLERTLVTIPNGDLSSREIENFATRDRYLFNPTIGLEYGVSPAQLKVGLETIERVLADHEKVDNEGARARLANFGPSSVDIDIFSYITVSEFTESLLVRQELLLAIFEQLDAAGLAIAFPTQTVHVVQEGP